MAPKPLRGAPSFLIVALLAAGPAGAIDVVVPDAGNVGTGGGQVGSAGVGGANTVNGVSAVPEMRLTLSPSIVPNQTPTLDRVDRNATVAAQLNAGVSLNPPAGMVGHDATKPVHWPPIHDATKDPASVAPVATKPKVKMTEVLASKKHAPPAIDGPVLKAASQGEIDRSLLGKEGVSPTTAKKLAEDPDAALAEMYDGDTEKTSLSAPSPMDDWEGPDTEKMFLVFKDEARVPRSGLTKAAANGVKPAKTDKVPGLELPPAPAGKPFSKTWFLAGAAKAKAFFKGGWKEIFLEDGGPNAKKAPTIQVLPPTKTAPAAEAAADDAAAKTEAKPAAEGAKAPAPQRRSETVLVRTSRGRRHIANGYRLDHVNPVAVGVTVVTQPDEDLAVRLDREPDDARIDLVRQHFATFNQLIEANFSALELMAQSSSKMTVKAANSLGSIVWEMSRLYKELTHGDEERSDEATGIQLELQRIASELQAATKGLSDNDLLPPKGVALVMPIDKRSLHYYVNRLHQNALDALGRGNNGAPANLTVKVEEKAVSLVDLSENPIVKEGRAVAPGFKALIAAMARSKDTPKGSLIMQDHQFWGHFRLGAHSAEVYANFLSPDEGGMIRVRYQEWGTGYDNQTRLYYVGRLLHKAGFHVEQQNGYLTAVVDKDHAAQSADEMTDTFALVVQALHATVGVDFALPLLVQGAKSSEEVGARIDSWVDVVMGEGTLPFYVHDDQTAMVEGWREYDGRKRERAALRLSLDAKLAELGLPPIPDDEVIGQRTLDRYVNEPVEKAIARGEILLSPERRLVRNPKYEPLYVLANSFQTDSQALGARMAEVVGSLNPDLFKYETIGMIGGMTVERAQRRLDPGSWLNVYVLRDPKTGQIGYARVEIAGLLPGGKPATISPSTLFSVLKAQGHPVAEFEPEEYPAGAGYFARLLKAKGAEKLNIERRFQGLAASTGQGRTLVTRVTYDKALAATGGHVFLAAYTTPDDIDAIKASKAVVTTSGGLLSHAAITTREMGIPAVILPRVRWKDGVAWLTSVSLTAGRPVGDLVVYDAKPTKPIALREGAPIRIDPTTGIVEVFPEELSAALLNSAARLELFDSNGDGKTLIEGLRKVVSSAKLRLQDKAVVAHEILSGLFSRSLEDRGVLVHLKAALAALPSGDSPLGVWKTSTLDRLYAEARLAAATDLVDDREMARESKSTASLERALGRAEKRVAALRELTKTLERRPEDLASLERGLTLIKAEGKARLEKLLAEEISELQQHARLFPAATVEALPRLKAAVGKARRRGLAPSMIASWEETVRRLEESRRREMEKDAPTAIPLAALLDVDVPWVGGKAAKLGEIAAVVRAAGGEVPPGIALTVHAYRRFLQQNGIEGKLDAIAKDKSMTTEQRANAARALLSAAVLSPEKGVGKEIIRSIAAGNLGGQHLAVRSSAVDEDGAEAAFAGAGDTHLYVEPSEVLEHVKSVWISLWNERALQYRESRGLSTANLAQAVVIQAMAHSEVSGVAFTQDPVTGSTGRMVVNAAFGLGEGIVSGRVSPDQYTMSKTDDPRELLPPMISDKKLAIVRGKGGKGTFEQKMPAEWRRRRSMTPTKLKKLVAVATALENHFGYALDIEFGFVGERLYILQARAVTTEANEATPAAPAVPNGSLVKPAVQPKAKKLMFVCTGNTCRSPMAAHMAREKLRRHGRGDIEVLSRGLSVSKPGAPISMDAAETLALRGIDPFGHEATQLTKQDVADATLILTMTQEQADAIIRVMPQAKDKVFPLGAYAGTTGDIADPYGRDSDAYHAAAIEIGDALDVFVAKIPTAQGQAAKAAASKNGAGSGSGNGATK